LNFNLSGNVLTTTPGGTSASAVTSGTLSADTTYMVLFKAEDVGSSVYDSYTVWINPTVTTSEGSLGANIGTGSGIIRELTAIDGTEVAFQSFNLTASLAAGQSFKVDEIKLGTSLGDVMVPVPEPSTFALLAGFLALAGVMVRRRLLS
jgi:hypothetical protein